MAVFPDIAPSQLIVTAQFRTIKIGTDGDFIQRRKKRDVPLMKFTIYWRSIVIANLNTLWDFYLARYGSYEDFAFFDFDSRKWSEFSIGTGNGAQTQFNLIAKETTGRVIKVNGVTKTEGVDFTFSAGAGTDGQDRITFGTAPTSGHSVTASLTGRKYYPRCIFESDDMDYEVFSYSVYSTGLILFEVTA